MLPERREPRRHPALAQQRSKITVIVVIRELSYCILNDSSEGEIEQEGEDDSSESTKEDLIKRMLAQGEPAHSYGKPDQDHEEKQNAISHKVKSSVSNLFIIIVKDH